MLGRLARYLRILGLDTFYIKNYRELPDIIEKAEHYCFFTKRIKNIPENSIIIKSDNIRKQMEEVFPVIKPFIEKGLILGRCLECNTILTETEKIDIEGRVPEFVYHSHDRFKICQSCGKIYWGGTHTEHMENWIKSFLGKDS